MAEETATAGWLEGSGSGSGGNGSGIDIRCHGAHKLHAQWVLTVFDQCIETPVQYAAFFIGLSSIICWLLAQVPQMVTNCRYGIADTALSFWFLLQWFLGDATNLIGAILSDQLATQTATAAYFVLIDTLMMIQFLYYLFKNQGLKGLTSCCRCPDKKNVLAIFLPGLMCTMLFASWPYLSLPISRGVAVGGASYSIEHRSGRVLLSHTGDSNTDIDVHDQKMFAGYVIGWVSAVLYVCSRVPQIVKNFCRCSVDGVSLPMFILAVLGNVTYALGIFLFSHESAFLIQKLPWLVGSVGTLCFDFTIFFQFFCIKVLGVRMRGNKVEVEIEDEEEKRPLLPRRSGGGREETGLPCFGCKGSIQSQPSAYAIESSSASDENVDKLRTSRYELPNDHHGHYTSGYHDNSHHGNQ